MYANDNGGYLPAARGEAGSENPDVWEWTYQVREYLPNTRAGLTPTVKDTPLLRDPSSKNTYRDYGFNQWLGMESGETVFGSYAGRLIIWGRNAKLDRIPGPSEIVMLGDINGGKVGCDGALSIERNPGFFNLGYSEYRHNGFANYLFVDGHVEAKSYQDWTGENENAPFVYGDIGNWIRNWVPNVGSSWWL